MCSIIRNEGLKNKTPKKIKSYLLDEAFQPLIALKKYTKIMKKYMRIIEKNMKTIQRF